MSSEHNSALVRRYFDECVIGVSGTDRDRALSIVDELLAADFVMFYSNETESQAARGRERHKEFLVEHARAYPEDHWTIEALVSDEGTVACHWRIRAIHARTRNRVDVRAADFYSVRDGRLAELRRFLDFADLRRQVEASSDSG